MPYEAGNDEAEWEAVRSLRPGAPHHRAYVGPPGQYDFMGATQFRLATALGLREEHYLLDLGCGSLRAGRLMISYLLPGRYYGVEPNEWLVEQALEKEIGQDLVRLKRPVFSSSADFDLASLGRRFDFVIAQSVFSHTGGDLFERGMQAVGGALGRKGQFLFTALTEKGTRFDRLPRGSEIRGWVYPECVAYPKGEIRETAERAGMLVESLNWFHPRQYWFRAVTDADLLLGEQAETMDSGRVLFDARFR